MSKKNKDFIIEQIKRILQEYKKLRRRFQLGSYNSSYYDSQEEGENINKLITKVKVLMSKYFKESQYYEQVEIHSSSVTKKNLGFIMGDLRALYENLIANYESPKDPKKVSFKYWKNII